MLLVGGGLLFFKGWNRGVKKGGRVLIGIARRSFLPEVVGYLRGDFLTAFLIGAAF